MKKYLLLILDTAILLYICMLFIISALSKSNIDIGLPNLIIQLSSISNILSFVIIGFVICLLRKENVFENVFLPKLNNEFRLILLITIIFHLILFIDSFKHPISYDFNRISFRRSFIKDLPLYIWFLRVYFQRLNNIEKKK